jgi:hypothetical protein
MKYWSFFVAKLLVAGALLSGLHSVLLRIVPKPETFMYVRFRDPFATDLGYTFTMWMFYLFVVGVVWLTIWDQRYRCRVCLRRLRMPVHTGAWTQVLFGAPRTEYICLYGHGTLTVDELRIHGNQIRDWEPHEDMWKELSSLEETSKT